MHTDLQNTGIFCDSFCAVLESAEVEANKSP